MKTVFITGGGTGLGKELAHCFSEKGFRIMLCGRRIEPLLQVKGEIEKLGGMVEPFLLDITDRAQIQERLVETGRLAKIDILINNAGAGSFDSFENMDSAEFEKMMNINYFGPLYLCKTLIPEMVRKESGTVINIISTAGLRGKANEAGYCASKFALRGLGESLQKEYENRVRVVNVFMGGMNTPFWDDSTHIQNREALMAPKEIAETVIEQYEKTLEIMIERKKH